MPRYRSHVALTVWPIGVLCVLGLARLWPALGGAPAYAAAAPASWLALGAETLVVVAFLIAYARGWRRFSTSDDDGRGPYRTAGSVRLQRFAGGIAWGFMLTLLILQWFMTIRVGPVAISHYELLRGFLSRPPVLGFYALGLAALGLYLSQGVAASFRAWGLGRGPETSRWLEVGCTVASVMLMLMAVNVLAHFATGRAYWTHASPADQSAAPTSPGGAR